MSKISISPSDVGDPTLEVAERQLAMLGELAEMAMAVSRAHARSAIAAARAVEAILGDEAWIPETSRARALAGARDAAESFQKVSRAVRLTLMLEKTTAQWLRDARLGIHGGGKDAGETPAILQTEVDHGRSAGCERAERATEAEVTWPDSERLVEIERRDGLPHGALRETVDCICHDLGVAPDWTGWTFEKREPAPTSGCNLPSQLVPHPPPCGGGGARLLFAA